MGSGRVDGGYEVEFAAEKEDAGAVVVEAAEAASIGLEGLDLGVEALGQSVGDAMFEVSEQNSTPCTTTSTQPD